MRLQREVIPGAQAHITRILERTGTLEVRVGHAGGGLTRFEVLRYLLLADDVEDVDRQAQLVVGEGRLPQGADVRRIGPRRAAVRAARCRLAVAVQVGRTIAERVAAEGRRTLAEAVHRIARSDARVARHGPFLVELVCAID